MRKIILLVCAMIVAMSNICLAGLNDNPTIAVLPFVDKAAKSEGLNFSDASVTSEFMIEKLLDSQRFYNVIERENMAAIINEHTFNTSMMIDPMTAVQLGKLLGAQYLIAGSITGLSTKEGVLDYTNSESGSVGGQKHKVTANVSARVIEVETGRIVMAMSGTGHSSSTLAEFTLRKKIDSDDEVTVTNDEDGIEEISEGTTSTVKTHKIRIGTTEVSMEQVRNALYKAVDDLIYNKQYGMLAKMDGSTKRRKV